MAAVVETACLWVLTHVVVLRLPIAFALAFAVAYLTLIAAIHILSLSSPNPPLSTQLRTYGLFGIAALLLVQVVVYLCDNLLRLNLTTINAAALAAVMCWVALGWPNVGRDV